ncbi:VOC family protein [Cohnella soli]|uniref:VOC family protein n=1 Tax=Cohnella soli TaxID=425005 RepID=A0ABW0HXM3_9BACL
MTTKLIPYLMSEDARKQAGFYVQALGGEIQSVMTFGQMPGTPEADQDKVMHLSVDVVGGLTIFMSEAHGGAVTYGRNICLSLNYDNVEAARAAFDGLAEEGGNIQFPLQLQPWGAFYGEVLDVFGVTWMIATQS